MLQNIQNQIVVGYKEDIENGLYVVSVDTRERDAEDQTTISSIVIRSRIIKDKHLGYMMLYDSELLKKLCDQPSFTDWYEAVSYEYRAALYESILSILECGNQLLNCQCETMVQIELNNFVSKRNPDGTVRWNPDNLATLMHEFGNFRSCDFTFTHPYYNACDIKRFDKHCTLECDILRDDIGLAPFGESL